MIARLTTLTSINYSKFVDAVIMALNKIKSETQKSNKNKRNMINYLIFELQKFKIEFMMKMIF